MADINVLLLRWSGGWLDIPSTTPSTRRKEALLSIGNIESPYEAVIAGRKVLALNQQSQERIVAGIHPLADPQTPYSGWRPYPNTYIVLPDWEGDPSNHKVVAMSVAQDDMTGIISYSPELQDPLSDQEERHQRWLKRMANGSLGGRSKQSSPERPIIQPHDRSRRPTATFSQSSMNADGTLQQILAGYSQKLPAESKGELREWYTSVTDAGSTPTRSQLLLNGAVVADASIAGGELSAKVTVSGVVINPNVDVLQARIVTAGVGATGWIGQARVDGIS